MARRSYRAGRSNVQGSAIAVLKGLTDAVQVRETHARALGTRDVLLHMNIGRYLRSREQAPASFASFRSTAAHKEVRRAQPRIALGVPAPGGPTRQSRRAASRELLKGSS
jgi:hypothetical protein